MLVSEGLEIIRSRTNDSESLVFTNNTLIHYLNLAISAVANQMIAALNPYLVKTLAVDNIAGAAIPADFHSLCPGEMCSIYDGNIWLDEYISSERTIRYFSAPAAITSLEDTIPFSSPYVSSVLNIAVEIAAMQIGMDVNQERQGHTLMSNLRAPIQVPFGMTGGGGNAAKG